jgi:hypothetical protein
MESKESRWKMGSRIFALYTVRTRISLRYEAVTATAPILFARHHGSQQESAPETTKVTADRGPYPRSLIGPLTCSTAQHAAMKKRFTRVYQRCNLIIRVNGLNTPPTSTTDVTAAFLSFISSICPLPPSRCQKLRSQSSLLSARLRVLPSLLRACPSQAPRRRASQHHYQHSFQALHPHHFRCPRAQSLCLQSQSVAHSQPRR